ncbi:MAG: hypothetical protein HC840_07440 [Leptolyngbyaceae cyanobacterium RM2_2_4]|nr:hypothetical protein [Leptolyngbyaceae cyanobacterium RM2_2_4]
MYKYAAEQQSTQITLKGMAIAPRFLDHGEELNRRYQEADSALTPLSHHSAWGDSLLACPVLKEGGRSRQVTLSKGNWYDFCNDNLLKALQK